MIRRQAAIWWDCQGRVSRMRMRHIVTVLICDVYVENIENYSVQCWTQTITESAYTSNNTLYDS